MSARTSCTPHAQCHCGGRVFAGAASSSPARAEERGKTRTTSGRRRTTGDGPLAETSVATSRCGGRERAGDRGKAAASTHTPRCWVRRQGKGKGKWKQEDAGGAEAEFDEWRARTQPGESCLSRRLPPGPVSVSGYQCTRGRAQHTVLSSPLSGLRCGAQPIASCSHAR